MKRAPKTKLEGAGFKVGTAQEFLNLSNEDMALIDLKITLIESLKAARSSVGVTQHELAKLIGSSQSRVAKLESFSPDVSLDFICKALFAIGVSRRQIGNIIAKKAA